MQAQVEVWRSERLKNQNWILKLSSHLKDIRHQTLKTSNIKTQERKPGLISNKEGNTPVKAEL